MQQQYGGVCLRRALSPDSSIAIILRGTIVNRTKELVKMVKCIVFFFMYTIGPINYSPP